MGILKKINRRRRAFMKGLTKNIGSCSYPKIKETPEDIKIEKVLICRPNGRLGNLLLVTPLVQEITAVFPNCKIDLMVKGNLAPILFENYDAIDHTIKLPKKPFKSLFKYFQKWTAIRRTRYDLIINVVSYSSSGRLATWIARGKYKLFGNDEGGLIASRYENAQHMAKFSVYYFRDFLLHCGLPERSGAVPLLDLKLSAAELEKGKGIVQNIVGDDKKTIALFTYATGHKCYSCDWWVHFYEALKQAFPECNILEILPIEKVSQISFQAPAFYSKDVREIGAVIANTNVFVGADSGIMHLASSVQTPTVGLFSVTDSTTYQPYGNNSLGVKTEEIGIEACLALIRSRIG